MADENPTPAPTPAPAPVATLAPAPVTQPAAPARVAAAPIEEPAAPEAKVPSFRLREANEAKDLATAEATRLRSQLDTTMQEFTLYREGITDSEDQGEFRDRYNRVPLDAEGKRVPFGDWLKGVKESRPKWSLPYLPAPPSDDDAPAPVASNRPNAPAPVMRPAGDPNANAATAPTTKPMSDAQIQAMRANGKLRGDALRQVIAQERAKGTIR